jgi:hypothetical protein
LPKFPFGKRKSRFPRPVRYIRNIVLAYLGFYLVLGFHAASSLDKIPASANVAIADTAGTNWLLVGSDSREGLTKAERYLWSSLSQHHRMLDFELNRR